MSKQVIILFGPPGAGKGTQSELLAEKMGLYLFETSKILESQFKTGKPNEVFTIEGKDYTLADELKKWKSGELNSPPWVTYLTMEEIKKLAEEGENVILSGSPRTVYEAEREMPLISEL